MTAQQEHEAYIAMRVKVIALEADNALLKKRVEELEALIDGQQRGFSKVDEAQRNRIAELEADKARLQTLLNLYDE